MVYIFKYMKKVSGKKNNLKKVTKSFEDLKEGIYEEVNDSEPGESGMQGLQRLTLRSSLITLQGIKDKIRFK